MRGVSEVIENMKNNCCSAHSFALWLFRLYSDGIIKREGFKVKNQFWTWKDWAEKIKLNFEEKFWSTGGYYKGTFAKIEITLVDSILNYNYYNLNYSLIYRLIFY